MKKVIIIGSSIVIVTLVLLFFHFQNYSLYDIDADNFKNKLKSSDNSIWDCMIDDYIPDNLGLWAYGSDYQIEHPLDTEVEIKHINSERKSVTIYHTPSNLKYFVVWKNKEPVACQISNEKFQFDPQLIKIIEQLILKNQFILKKSSLINGNDILIKETDSDFIIIVMNKKCDYNNTPMSLYISTYSKKRFY